MHFFRRQSIEQCLAVALLVLYLPGFYFLFLSQILMTVRATPVKMVALASMVSTPISVSVATAGRGPTVKPVSLWSFGGQTSLGLGRGRENQYENLFLMEILKVRPQLFLQSDGIACFLFTFVSVDNRQWEETYAEQL